MTVTALTDLSLDLEDQTDTNLRLVRGWMDAVQRAFHLGAVTDDDLTRWIDAQRASGAVMRGIWDESAAGAQSPVPIATFASSVGTLDTGEELISASMITDVTVAPTHRRRGLMKTLMTDHLHDVASSGLPVALLTATEGEIYQRFGFGVAVREASVTVATDSRFRLRRQILDGRVVMLESHAAWPMIREVSESAHQSTRGSISMPTHYEPWLRDRYDWKKREINWKLRYAVHLNSAGEPRGFVVYEVDSDREPAALTVHHLRASEPAAYLSLWQFLGDVDLVEHVRWNYAPVLDPLPLALSNARSYAVKGVRDHLWIRLLDVAAALSARPWFADGSLTLEVADPLEHAAGRFAIATSAGHASVETTTAAPDLTIDIETLGGLYLGDVSVRTLVRAGRLTGERGTLELLSAMIDGGDSPDCSYHF